MYKRWITEDTPVAGAPRLNGVPLTQRPTPSPATMTVSLASPEQGQAQGRTPTPSATFRAMTPTPVVKDQQQLRQLSAKGIAGASSILPRMYGAGKSAEFDDSDDD